MKILLVLHASLECRKKTFFFLEVGGGRGRNRRRRRRGGWLGGEGSGQETGIE